MFTAICDDEKTMQNCLIRLLQEYSAENGVDIFVDKFENGFDLLRSTRKYEVIFMDYQMNGIDGIETARKIREANCDSVIIFISAYPEAALDSFEVGTFRFLKKPVDKLKVFRALDDYMKSVDHDNFLMLKARDGVWRIKVSDIVYAEAKGKHTIIRTVKDFKEAFVHLKVIENKLPPHKFIRCQRAYIAGFGHISNHTNKEIFFDNGEKALIGKAYLKKFKEEFQNYIIRYNS
ncbi:MAG: LytTR family DNA-binding domain-containing protein, partial [Oscillospiraceae bacterium]|nr:LytTR family DNA-binding domain-containing protein [Oscillospiraceae bacterium]